MMRLSKLRFRNFRAFEEWTEIEIKPITVLYGWNSAGKSTILRLLTWISQSFEQESSSPMYMGERSIFKGYMIRDLVHFGNIAEPIGLELYFDSELGEVCLSADLFYRSEQHPIVLMESRLSVDLREIYRIEYATSSQQGNQPYSLIIGSATLFEDFQWRGIIPIDLLLKGYLNEEGQNLLRSLITCIQKVNYLGPHRAVIGINLTPGYLNSIRIGHTEDGFSGSFVPQILFSEYKRGAEAFRRIQRDFETIFPGRELFVNSEGNVFNIKVRVAETDKSALLSSVGEGMIQSLPFVTMCNLNGPHRGSVDMVEQPELHLHPAAQGAILDLFISGQARQGSSYLLETHSENILLRLRVAVSEGRIACGSIGILWVEQFEDGRSSVRRIEVDHKGEVDWWPDGVFSEDFVEVKRLRRAQNAYTPS